MSSLAQHELTEIKATSSPSPSQSPSHLENGMGPASYEKRRDSLEDEGAGAGDLDLETTNLMNGAGSFEANSSGAGAAATIKDAVLKKNQSGMPAWLLIAIWISLSTGVIFQNAHILKQLDFPFPVTLTSIHLLFQTIFTRLLAKYTDLIRPPGHTTSDTLPSNSRSNEVLSGIKSPNFWKRIVPIGALFSASLVLSNYVYMFLSVSFIQMIKSASPVAVLIASFAFGLRQPNLRLICIICSISIGVAIASYGEADFNMAGFLIQILAIAVEASRLSLIELLLSGVGMSPLESLHAFAPVCLAFLVAMILPFEGFEPFRRLSNLGLPLIFFNASLTCALNLSSIYLIGISSVVMSLSKVVKDILIIFASAIVLGTPITLVQWAGYAIALIGLYLYKVYG